MSSKSTYTSQEATDKRIDLISVRGNSILSKKLKSLGLAASPETFTQNLYTLLESLSCRLSLAELYLKEANVWKSYQREVQERDLW